jgi:hypothetical protein
MAKKYNTRITKLNYAYSLQQIAELYDVSIRTVRYWLKEGLLIIEGIYPYRIKGFELKRYLDEKQQGRKIKLLAGEFYCTKCKQARKSLNNIVTLKYSGKTIGRGIKDFTIQGACEVCNTKLNLFSNENKLEEIQQIFEIAGVIGA